MTRTWAAHVTRAEVTPPLGLPLDGYADRTGPADTVLDPLEVNVVVLDDRDAPPIAWVSLDAIAVTASLRAYLAPLVAGATGVAEDRVVLTASHTHAGPAGWAGQIHPVLPAKVDTAERDRLGAAVTAALHRTSSHDGELRYAEATVSGGGANRHDSARPHDASLGLLTLLEAGRPVAVVFDHACHPTVLGPENHGWSSDWVGFAREAIRAAAGNVPVVFLQGASGDVSPRFVRRGRDHAEAVRIGAVIGNVAARLVGHGETVAPHLTLTRGSISLQARQDALPQPSRVTNPTDRLTVSREEGARSHAALAAHPPGAPPLEFSSLTLGRRRWLHLGAEIFTAWGRELAADGATRVVGCTDGYAGYLADEPAHADGEYEALASFIDLAETQRAIAAITRRTTRELTDADAAPRPTPGREDA